MEITTNYKKKQDLAERISQYLRGKQYTQIKQLSFKQPHKWIGMKTIKSPINEMVC